MRIKPINYYKNRFPLNKIYLIKKIKILRKHIQSLNKNPHPHVSIFLTPTLNLKSITLHTSIHPAKAIFQIHPSSHSAIPLYTMRHFLKLLIIINISMMVLMFLGYHIFILFVFVHCFINVFIIRSVQFKLMV